MHFALRITVCSSLSLFALACGEEADAPTPETAAASAEPAAEPAEPTRQIPPLPEGWTDEAMTLDGQAYHVHVPPTHRVEASPDGKRQSIYGEVPGYPFYFTVQHHEVREGDDPVTPDFVFMPEEATTTETSWGWTSEHREEDHTLTYATYFEEGHLTCKVDLSSRDALQQAWIEAAHAACDSVR